MFLFQTIRCVLISVLLFRCHVFLFFVARLAAACEAEAQATNKGAAEAGLKAQRRAYPVLYCVV